MTHFTHINKQGNAKMVDVSNKEITKRVAEAHSSIIVNEKFIDKLLKILIVKEMYLILRKLLVLWQLKHFYNHSYVSSITTYRHRYILQMGFK